MEARHVPVLTGQVLSALQIRDGGAYIDCTVGEGGHASAILGAGHVDVRLLGIDKDEHALSVARVRLSKFGERVILVHGNFAELERLATENGFLYADGLLFDLGLSSLQLETAERGFSFSRAGRLDMRFDTTEGVSAFELVNRTSETELADIIWQFGEEPKARSIARAIVKARPIETTVELAEVVRSAAHVSRRGGIHPATRAFQALRMVVNAELQNIEAGLEQAIKVLSPEGRMVVISYHSLEDRLVKTFIRDHARDCICPPETPVCTCNHKASVRAAVKKALKPSEAEIEANPRSRSAKLRAAEKLGPLL